MFLPQKNKIINMWNDGYVVYLSYGKYLPIYDHLLIYIKYVHFFIVNCISIKPGEKTSKRSNIKKKFSLKIDILRQP